MRKDVCFFWVRYLESEEICECYLQAYTQILVEWDALTVLSLGLARAKQTIETLCKLYGSIEDNNEVGADAETLLNFIPPVLHKGSSVQKWEFLDNPGNEYWIAPHDYAFQEARMSFAINPQLRAEPSFSLVGLVSLGMSCIYWKIGTEQASIIPETVEDTHHEGFILPGSGNRILLPLSMASGLPGETNLAIYTNRQGSAYPNAPNGNKTYISTLGCFKPVRDPDYNGHVHDMRVVCPVCGLKAQHITLNSQSEISFNSPINMEDFTIWSYPPVYPGLPGVLEGLNITKVLDQGIIRRQENVRFRVPDLPIYIKRKTFERPTSTGVRGVLPWFLPKIFISQPPDEHKKVLGFSTGLGGKHLSIAEKLLTVNDRITRV